MKAESIAFAVAGMCFGVILGWVLATQEANRPNPFAPAPGAGAAAPPRPVSASRPALDETRVQALQAAIEKDPKNAGNYAQLGNVYFDAEQWPERHRRVRALAQARSRTTRMSAPISASATTTRTGQTRRWRSSSTR